MIKSQARQIHKRYNNRDKQYLKQNKCTRVEQQLFQSRIKHNCNNNREIINTSVKMNAQHNSYNNLFFECRHKDKCKNNIKQYFKKSLADS